MASVFPNTCQVIKISGFFIENVDNDALEIDERPVRVLMSLDMVRLKTGFGCRFRYGIHHGFGLRGIGAVRNDKIIRQGRDLVNFDDFNLLCFFVIQCMNNQLDEFSAFFKISISFRII